MQVFQRGVNESLVIDQDVIITVLDIQPHCVRIGVRNPDACPAYYEKTLYFDNGEESEPSYKPSGFPFEAESYCFEEELELTGSHLGSW